MIKGTLPQGANKYLEVLEEALRNTTELGGEIVGGKAVPKQGRDTGGIEPDAYTESLLIDWEEAVRTMGLRPDLATYSRYETIRYWRLFDFRIDGFGNRVISENRVPPRLMPEENLSVVAETIRDMELVKSGEAALSPSGALILSRPMRPDDTFGTPEARIRRELDDSTPLVSILRAASAPRATQSDHAYAMSIRPGERKTQRIELPGLTLDLVIAMPG